MLKFLKTGEESILQAHFPQSIRIKEEIIERDAKGGRKLINERAGNRHIHVFAPASLNYFEIPHELHYLRSAEPALEDMHLKDPHEQHCDVAYEEMAFDAVFLLQEYRSCIKGRLHHPEGLLYPPQRMVCRVYVPGTHPGLRSHKQVVSSKLQILICL